MAFVCPAITWQRPQFTFSRLAADLYPVSQPHIVADGGGGAAGSVITENCCVGKIKVYEFCYKRADRKGVCGFVKVCIIRLQPCCALAQLGLHLELAVAYQLPTV
ncbi:hypothetical protein ILYODFUR_029464 [Ilyodon furcidens]|uniref:Uncharacterized protein n=1 Tax=Ilyodon furcidens TaxID=33524 RepID=A0ABV0VI93_9TELE